MILKLGGSLITNKDVPLSPNKNSLRRIAAAIRESGLPKRDTSLFLVHGGGSYGHFFAKKFHLSMTPDRIKPIGIAQTAAAMLELHHIVVRSLFSHGIATETILPSELLDADLQSISEQGQRHVRNSIENGLIPITFGYIALDHNRAFIISGDSICKAIANSMSVDRVVFAMDVDGIYPSSELKGRIITKLSGANRIDTKSRRYDVTGGLESKVKLGFELRMLGSQVFYLNGTKPKRLANVLVGKYEKIATEIVA